MNLNKTYKSLNVLMLLMCFGFFGLIIFGGLHYSYNLEISKARRFLYDEYQIIYDDNTLDAYYNINCLIHYKIPVNDRTLKYLEIINAHPEIQKFNIDNSCYSFSEIKHYLDFEIAKIEKEKKYQNAYKNYKIHKNN